MFLHGFRALSLEGILDDSQGKHRQIVAWQMFRHGLGNVSTRFSIGPALGGMILGGARSQQTLPESTRWGLIKNLIQTGLTGLQNG